MPDLPARFAARVITFAPLLVQRSWPNAQVLPVGAILARSAARWRACCGSTVTRAIGTSRTIVAF